MLECHDSTRDMEWKKVMCYSFEDIFCIGYMHVDDHITTKVDDNSKKMIFVGYYEKYKGYKLYNLNEWKIVISIDIEYNEGV